MRLDKFLAHKGWGTRTEVKALIRKGEVSVNGVTVQDGGHKLQLDTDTITVQGQTINTDMVYYIRLHKPAGYVTAREDSHHSTVMELLPDEMYSMNVSPVGRLDKDTEGLLLLTNDGQWGHRIIHGKRHVEKEYQFTYEGTLVVDACAQVAAGLTLEDGDVCKPATLTLGPAQTGTLILTEGKYHQVKRMVAVLGGTVTYLKRVRIGSLTLDGIENPGDFCKLSIPEVENFV